MTEIAKMAGRSLFALSLLALTGGAGIAQPQTAPPATGTPNAEQRTPTSPNGTAACPDPTGRDLARSCGVITPPATGDTGVIPTPNQGTMPVVPPPGTPGGNQNVQPK